MCAVVYAHMYTEHTFIHKINAIKILNRDKDQEKSKIIAKQVFQHHIHVQFGAALVL